MIEQGLNAMGRLVADIIVETLQRQGVVGDTLNLIARSSRGVVCKGGGVAPLIDLPRSMSVIKHRCRGLTAIAQPAGAIGYAHSQIFYGCRKRASGSAAGSRLVFAGASAELS
jgi:hypothetical protein